MATSAENQLYPFSTNDGQAIPLEVIRPLGLTVALVGPLSTMVILPEQIELCLLYSSVDAVVDFASSPASDPIGSHQEALFLPAGTLMTAIVPGVANLSVIPIKEEEGIFSIQTIQKWAGIGTQRQLSRR